MKRERKIGREIAAEIEGETIRIRVRRNYEQL